MKKNDFVRLQDTQLQIMDEVHRICTKHGIRYYMIGGTLLGAIRHKGIIPWDLDIDIAMPRASYELFKQVCEVELNPRYVYRDYRNTKDFNHPHALVCIRGTKLYSRFDHLNPTAENMGIYLDIFPLDTAPEDIKAQAKQAQKIKLLRLLRVLRVKYVYSSSIIKRLCRKVIRGALFWLSVDYINELEEREMVRYRDVNSSLICSMASHYAYSKQCMPNEVYGEPTLYDFSGRKYYGVEKYDEYLKRIYGDYMKLPPVEDQEANLDAFVSVEFD